jgi:hypothetical protein
MERLYVIKGMTYDGLDIYTKGKVLTKEGVDLFLCPHLINAKHRWLGPFHVRSVGRSE